MKTGLEFLSQKLGDSIIILASDKSVAVKVSDNFVEKGINAGEIVGEIARATGANGGGRPNFAQGGIKDYSKLDDILPKIEAALDLKAISIEGFFNSESFVITEFFVFSAILTRLRLPIFMWHLVSMPSLFLKKFCNCSHNFCNICHN